MAIFAIALAVRLWQVDLTRFADDDVGLLQNTLPLLDTGKLPLTSGESFSVGIQEPPLILYVLAAAELVKRDPLWLAQVMAGLSALGAPLVYFTGARIGGSVFAGLASGLFYAFNPASAVYGRMIPNTALVVLLAALGLVSK